MPIPSPLGYGRLWRTAARGQAVLQTACVPAPPWRISDLRRAQAFLRVLGIHISFGREGRAGIRVITMHVMAKNTVSTVRDNAARPGAPEPALATDHAPGR